MTAKLIFLLSAAFFFYVMIGYPILLGLWARFAKRPVKKGAYEPLVSVVIPVCNGARYIHRKLDSVLALDYPREKLHVLMISDGSTDETDDYIREYAAEGVQLLRVPNGGKPAALNAALPHIKGDIIFLTDIRQELERSSLRRLLECFADPSIGVASGELVIRRGDNLAEVNIGIYRKFETWMRVCLSAVDSVLGATGSIYAIRRPLMVQMPPDTLLDDVYVPLAAFFRGYRTVLEPSARAYDDPTSLSTEFRRKVRTLAGNYQIMQQYPALLTSRNRMWFHFMSHKFGRLMLPFALIAIAACTFFLPRDWMLAALAGQVLFYGCALVDQWVAEGSILKKLTSPARTFVVMMAATACAISYFFVSPQKLWTPTQTRAGNAGPAT